LVWVTVVALQILLNDTYKLNHCKEMGAKLGRRFLKQPAEKLKEVFVDFGKSCTLHNHSCIIFIQKHPFSHLCHDSESVYGVFSVS